MTTHTWFITRPSQLSFWIQCHIFTIEFTKGGNRTFGAIALLWQSILETAIEIQPEAGTQWWRIYGYSLRRSSEPHGTQCRVQGCGAGIERPPHPYGCGGLQVRQANSTPFSVIGRCVTRSRPEAAIAFASAGPAGGVPGSPMPEGASFVLTICTSMALMSRIRSGS